MLDRYSTQWIKKPLHKLAQFSHKKNIKADQVTFWGFIIGLLAFPLLSFGYYDLALICIILNRICDGLDGALARIQGLTDAGGFLDISLDFLFYALIPLGFIFADPTQNGLAGAFLMFSFVGTGTSFLAFASVADKYNIENPDYSHKSLYYMAGIAEGTETILFFIIACLFPDHFAILAYTFAGICILTTINRIYSGYTTLRKFQNDQ